MAGQGTKILASDYNVVQSAVATVLGTGSGTLGYGQTVNSSQIVGSPIITAAQWNNLLTDITNTYLHQGSPGNLSVPSAPVAGTTKVTAADYSKYLALSNAITTNANITPPVGQASLTTLTTGIRTTAWNGTITHTVTLTFSTEQTARFFFNSGGQLRIAASLTGYPTDGSYAKDQDWNMLLANMGTITMNYNSCACSGSYNILTSDIGFYQLTTSQTNIFRKSTSSPTYTPNRYDIFANVDSVSAPRILTLQIQFEDLSAPGGYYGIDENIEGTLSSVVQAYYATGSNVSVTAPSGSTSVRLDAAQI